MGLEQLRIREIVRQAAGKHLDIPEFQRNQNHFSNGVDDEQELKERWDVQRYTDFLIERSQLLAQFANRFLDKWGTIFLT